jgi:hypothetical protein
MKTILFLMLSCGLSLFTTQIFAADESVNANVTVKSDESANAKAPVESDKTLPAASVITSTTMSSTPTKTQSPSQQTKVAIIEAVSKADFESKFEPIWKRQFEGCSKCGYQNFTPYNESGDFNPKNLEAALIASKGYAVVYLGWNQASNKSTAGLESKIQELLDSGSLVIARTGVAGSDSQVLPLSKTIMTKIADVVIVGDLVEKERLYPRTFFGPEMMTAVQAPKNEEIKNIGALLFTAKLVQKYKNKDTTQWLAHFKSIKVKSRKLWPSLNDVF